MTDDSKTLDPQGGKPGENREIDEFFERLPSNFRWPKPNADAIAAAVEAIQRMSGGTQVAHELNHAGDQTADSATSCSACGGSLPAHARFCVWCGMPRDAASAGTPYPQTGASVQHHVHHHYHHMTSPSGAPAEAEAAVPRGRASGTTASGGRAETGARQVAQDWAQACNTRHIDDLVELYTADSTLIRQSVPPVRSLPAIREFLLSMLEAGLGDVEMESLRIEVLGEVAVDLGRCKMLVPVAMGKRREERGKYLLVLVRQPAGTWKILADSWSADQPVASHPTGEPAVRKGTEPSPPARKPR